MYCLFNKRSLFIAAFLLVQSCGNMPVPYNPAPNAQEGGGLKPITFRFIDVGEGDATLVTTPNGKNILIDAGYGAMGKARVLPLLENTEIELIIASHYDSDHIGGIPEVLKGGDGLINTGDDIIPASGILDRGDAGADTSDLSDYFIIAGDLRYSLQPGDEFEVDGVRFAILCQNGAFADGYQIDVDAENENAHSISLLISYGSITYLTSGDLPGPNFPNQYEPYDLESHLAELIGHADIIHVSHHGSHNSTSKEFVNTLSPKIAIISVGENDYGHPHPSVLETLLNAGAEIYLTEGDICLTTDGYRIAINKC